MGGCVMHRRHCIHLTTKAAAVTQRWSVGCTTQGVGRTTNSCRLPLCRFADYIPGSDLRFDNPVKHGASSFLLLLDVALSRMPLVSYHLQVRCSIHGGLLNSWAGMGRASLVQHSRCLHQPCTQCQYERTM